MELGVDLIDTADSYGPEVSENLIAEALHPYPDGLVIATKGGLAGPGPGSGRATRGPEHLKECCEASLRRLKLDRIDLYQLHSPDPQVPLRGLGRRAEGAAGRGQDPAHRHLQRVASRSSSRRAGSSTVVTVQNRYNLEDRDSEDVLDACEAEGIGFIPWFPLATGRLARAGRRRSTGSRAQHDATPGQIALAWLLARSPVMLPIPGTSSVAHLEENVAAATIGLTQDEVVAVGSASEG